MAVAFSSNGASDSDQVSQHSPGNLYSTADDVYVKFTFQGDRSGASSDWATNIAHGDMPNNSAIIVSNSNNNAAATEGSQDYTSSTEFTFTYKLENLNDGATTVTFPCWTYWSCRLF